MLNDVSKPQQQHGPPGHSAESQERGVALTGTLELDAGPGQLRVSIYWPGARPSLVTEGRPATHATFSHWQRSSCSAGGSDTQAYDGAVFFLFLYLSTFS